MLVIILAVALTNVRLINLLAQDSWYCSRAELFTYLESAHCAWWSERGEYPWLGHFFFFFWHLIFRTMFSLPTAVAQSWLILGYLKSSRTWLAQRVTPQVRPKEPFGGWHLSSCWMIVKLFNWLSIQMFGRLVVRHMRFDNSSYSITMRNWILFDCQYSYWRESYRTTIDRATVWSFKTSWTVSNPVRQTRVQFGLLYHRKKSGCSWIGVGPTYLTCDHRWRR